MDYDFILLLARQRSGTSALGSIMNKHPELFYPGEPFHIGHSNKETSFFHFKDRMIQQDHTAFLPDRDPELLSKFIGQINQRYKSTPFLDLKYNQTHFLNGVSYLPTQQPWIVRHALQTHVPIIHLTRKNQLKVFVSELRAKLTGVWHAKTDIKVENDAVEIDTDRLLQHIKTSDEVMKMFAGWLQNRRNVFTIDYDELFTPNGHLSENAVNGIGRIAKLDQLESLKSDFVKTASNDLSEAIANYSEVEAVLAETPYAWMLK